MHFHLHSHYRYCHRCRCFFHNDSTIVLKCPCSIPWYFRWVFLFLFQNREIQFISLLFLVPSFAAISPKLILTS
eukprot:UN15909